MKLSAIYRIALIASVLFLALSVVYYGLGNTNLTGASLVLFFVTLSWGIRRYPNFKGFTYTVIIFAAVTCSMFFPNLFREVGGFDLKILIIPLLQIIMFGMGTQMSFKDFVGVIRMPKAVGVGLLCQFSIMPLIGVSIALLFQFPPEIAAGIILVGSSPSGLASNVMTYLARANIALSVTLTAVATLLAPLITPLWMQLLASQFIPIDFWAMVWSMFKIVLLPVASGLLFNHFLQGRAKWLHQMMPFVSMFSIAFIITIITAAGRESLLQIGLLLILATIIHNLLGYVLGYWSCRVLGFDEKSCRTIALEVGMQNSGLASGIALEMGKVATIGLAPAVFGPLMNITGSSLATYWRERSPDGEEDMRKDNMDK